MGVQERQASHGLEHHAALHGRRRVLLLVLELLDLRTKV
jgi:hypothetical protein